MKKVIENIVKQMETELTKDQLSKLEVVLNEEMAKESPNHELIASIQEQMSKLNIEQVDYSVGLHEIILPFDKSDDLSYEVIYERLKLDPIFEGSENC